MRVYLSHALSSVLLYLLYTLHIHTVTMALMQGHTMIDLCAAYDRSESDWLLYKARGMDVRYV